MGIYSQKYVLDRIYAHRFADLLREGYSVHVANDGALIRVELWKRVDQWKYDDALAIGAIFNEKHSEPIRRTAVIQGQARRESAE